MAEAGGGEAALVTALFARAGIEIGGGADHDPIVHDPRFFAAVIRDGELGLGESYMLGWWDCARIDRLAARLITSGFVEESYRNPRVWLYHLLARVSGRGSRRRAFEVGQHHYDLGNDLFEVMLDQEMVYSCADWTGTDSLDRAQEQKLDLVCRKLGLRPGMRVLDIGCGWGGFARHAAVRYGVSVVGLTVSREQAELARARTGGLPIEIRVGDYRTVEGRFDAVASIAMFEAVGHRYYSTFMETVDRCLADDGRFLLHSIVANEPIGAAKARFLDKYIFPNGEAPSLAQIMAAAEPRFTVEALHRLDGYDRTLEAWLDRFAAGWPQLSDAYGDRFFRMWTFYLQISRAIFRSRLAHVWHIVLSRQRPGRIASPVFLPRDEIEAR